jgi:hypothetical protein
MESVDFANGSGNRLLRERTSPSAVSRNRNKLVEPRYGGTGDSVDPSMRKNK